MTLDQFDIRRDLFDSFNQPITGARNDGDLPGHYVATPERYRLYVDGTRTNWYYDTVTTYPLEDRRTGETDVFVLTPSGGETVRFESATRFRYLVGYESESTLALQTNQDLQGDDEVLVYIGRDDGYHFHFNASRCEIRTVRDGTAKDSLEVPTAVGLTVFSRFVVRYNWYNVGHDVFLRTFTRNGKQFEPVLGELSVDGERGPEDANPRVGVEVSPDSSTSGLEVLFGSLGYTVQSDVERTSREKSFTADGLDHSGSGDWEPLAAIRHESNEQNVVAEIGQITPNTTPGNNDRVAMQTIDSALCTVDWNDPFDDGSNVSPRAPPDLVDYDTPIVWSEAVTEVPDHTGATTTTSPYSVARTGGYQVAHASSTGGTAGQESKATSTRRIKQVNDPDYGVIFGKTSSAGDFNLDVDVQFDY